MERESLLTTILIRGGTKVNTLIINMNRIPIEPVIEGLCYLVISVDYNKIGIYRNLNLEEIYSLNMDGSKYILSEAK
jgi:hypothetical protein